MAEETGKETTPTTGGDKTFTQAELDRVVADRLTRERAKFDGFDDFKAKAAQFDSLEAASKSEAQKQADAAAAANRRADDAEARALRLEVATAKGLKPTQVKRLVGTTREELEADADEMLVESGPMTPPKPDDPKPNVTRRPNPTLNGGGDPTTEAEETDPSKLASAIRAGL